MGAPSNPVFQEARHTGGFVVWDPSDGMTTREAVLLLAGSGLCLAGLVLAALLTAGAAVANAIGANVGNGTFGAIVASTAARIGTYAVEFDDPTHFVVTDPSGQEIGHGNTGAAFNAGGLGFTINAGATAFAPGDSFAIAVTGVIKYVPFDPTATDGHQVAAAILWSGYRDATNADKRAIVVLRGPIRVQAAELVWGPNVTQPAQQAAALAQLARLGILNT
jgi:hypothetical protein